MRMRNIRLAYIDLVLTWEKKNLCIVYCRQFRRKEEEKAAAKAKAKAGDDDDKWGLLVKKVRVARAMSSLGKRRQMSCSQC